jgi:hypothetical protein
VDGGGDEFLFLVALAGIPLDTTLLLLLLRGDPGEGTADRKGITRE